MKDSKSFSLIRFLRLGLTLGCFLLIISLVIVPGDRDAEADIYTNNVVGWIWSANFGWASLNSVNEETGAEYGLKLESKEGPMPGDRYMELSGWAWMNWGETMPDGSPIGDWVCFGTACEEIDWDEIASGTQVDDPPVGDPSFEIRIDEGAEGEGLVTSGWARVLSLGRYGNEVMSEPDWGWISMTSENDPAATVEYGAEVDFSKRELGGYGWGAGGTDINGTYIPEAGLGWVKFHEIGLEVGEIEVTVTDDHGDPVNEAAVVATAFDVALNISESYQCITDSSGICTLEGIKFIPNKDEPDPGIAGDYYDYRVVAVKEGYNFTADVVDIYPDGPDKNALVVLSQTPTGGDSISGSVVSSADGNPSIPGAIVFSEMGGQSAITNSQGEFTINKLKLYAVPPVLIAAATGYKTNSLSAPDYDFILEPAADYRGRVVVPWLQTLMGDVHINNPTNAFGQFAPPLGYGSATYLITSGLGDIYHFRSWAKAYDPDPAVRRQDWVIDENYKIGDTFQDAVPAFGDTKIDIDTLIEEAQEITQNELESGLCEGSSDYEGLYRVGNGEVSVDIQGVGVAGTCTIGQNAKTLVVDSDVNIGANMVYEDVSVSKDDLPSFGLIVRGDVNISPAVNHTVGSWYVKGNVYTGSGNTIWYHEGLIVAEGYHFERTFINDSEGDLPIDFGLGLASLPFELANGEPTLHFNQYEAPAEIVFYDGRVVLNTPPGFGDMTSMVPEWSDTIPR